MYTELGVKDILNKSIVDWKYEILSKKDAATSPEREFLEQFTNVSIKDTPSMFNPFSQLDCKYIPFFCAQDCGKLD